MKKILNLMIDFYNLKGIDFMGYKVSRNNPYTYHHILKRCLGGNETFENGAVLTKISHQYLHIIESRDLMIYEYINNVFKQITEQGYGPTENQLLAIDYVLRTFEEEHIQDKSAKGKILIRREFLKR